jgi:hypothetical protein
MALEWEQRPYEVGKMSVVGNVMRAGPSTDPGLPFMMLGGDGDLEYYGRDNVAIDKYGNPLPMFGRYGHTKAKLIELPQPPSWPAGLEVMPAAALETHLMADVGARPWDRDDDDRRVLFFIPEGRGEIINDEKDASAYPEHKPTRAPFVEADWDLATMEPKSGLYPGQKAPAR